ncbi:FimV/HubP family polar landmark protein [Candidatus Photodesmus anomalopis]|uniref:FimV/HubP family polar landmark protein n=1 Tax=Candidatus Photodesmus anomalopis TaxID=28176 RepID=UPI000409C2BC|nr:FimV/HubP family polar landmark protein [Candidatus Photodesmus katoptron]
MSNIIDDIALKDSSVDEEAVDNLNLAKMYIEMNDIYGAIKLLEKVIVDGTDEIRREAKLLIDSLQKQSNS